MKRLIPVVFMASLFSTCNEVRLKPVLPPDACVPLDEICNGIDDDCDGIVDNPGSLEIKPCYTADQSTLAYGICRFGVERCLDGGVTCVGQVTPQIETCNNIDDNCNGLVDEIHGSGVDIIFAVDYSSSMSDKITMINQIVTGWTTKYANRTNIKVALVGIPSDDGARDKQVYVMLPLSDIPTFVAEITRHAYVAPNGSEPSLDAIYFLTDRRNPMLINWTPDYARSLFIFTDENPQSYTMPPVSEISAKTMAAISNVNVFIFTNEPSWSNWNTYSMFNYLALTNSIDDAIQRGACQ